MSFSGTPLGQGRRLDHHTFLNKPHLATSNQNTFHPRPILQPATSPQRSIPASYAYGAPTAGSRSPAKPVSAGTSQSVPNLDSADNQDETALVRYARLKREQSLNTSSLQPEKWAVKDTSVNIATAFIQAASTSYDMNTGNPNNSWASGSQTNLNVPRSTSVEYEKETHSTSNRRLAAPPSRLTQRTNRKPLSKQASGLTHVSDSEGEEQSQSQSVDNSARGKSPFEHVMDISKRALGSATSFYMRQRSTEPADVSAATSNGRDSSYDYASEDREYQEMQRQHAQEPDQLASKKSTASHRRNRMSVDNKAYRPSMSDLDESDDEVSDDGKRRRKKMKKKDLGGGPLTSLPVAGYDKRRKKKTGTKGAAAGEGEEDQDSSSGSEQRSSAQRASVSRESVIRTSVPPPARMSAPRGSVPPQSRHYPGQEDSSHDVESGLEAIVESDEPPLVDGVADTSDRPSRSFSIGGFLGWLVNRIIWFFWTIFTWILRAISAIFLILGRIVGSTVDIFFQKPVTLISSIDPRPFIVLGKLAIAALAIYLAWFKLYDPLMEMLPSRTSTRPYYAPDAPITNLDELTARLQNIEAALSGLSLDNQRARAQQDLEARAQGEVVNRIYALEARIREEAKRIGETETHLETSARQGLSDMRRQIEVLQAQLSSVESAPRETSPPPPPPANDEEARKKLRLLEERLGTVEGGVKEAIELSKASAKESSPAASGPAWWSKLASAVGTGTGFTIKSSDGTDITGLISQLVDNAVTRSTTRDIISRADFALHSAGARPIPHLTSHTLEMRPTTFRGKVLGWMTGHGREIGRSPITALHQDIHSGLCWPMTGDFGQLGVALASPAYISDITIDHIAKEVAFDLRTAPRDMEVWGLVEGKENLEKVIAFRAERAAQLAEARRLAEESGSSLIAEADEDAYPPTLPANEPFVRLASFTYDIDAPSNIQTFPVRPEIQELGVDFGVIALVIKNNWGKQEYTCLYRFRVHGERLGGMPHTYIPEDS
ncbi:hypothetical protein HYDPIDRAFT_38336 [Hydnomerulius pinastri MD-312]|nr:hypothetical protein HYDPIDRAFT_38336 [Hydnomerulius pinastri MD-312]